MTINVHIRNSRRNMLIYLQSDGAYANWAQLDQLTPEQSKTLQVTLETMLMKLSRAPENEPEEKEEDELDWSKYRGGEILDVNEPPKYRGGKILKKAIEQLPQRATMREKRS